MATNPADKPRGYRDEIEAILDEMDASVGGDWSKIIHAPPPMTDEELAQMEAEEEQWIAQLKREEAEWRAAHPGEPRICGSDLIDEDRGPH